MYKTIYFILTLIPIYSFGVTTVEEALLLSSAKKKVPPISLLEKIDRQLQRIDNKLVVKSSDPLECAADERLPLESVPDDLLPHQYELFESGLK